MKKAILFLALTLSAFAAFCAPRNYPLQTDTVFVHKDARLSDAYGALKVQVGDTLIVAPGFETTTLTRTNGESFKISSQTFQDSVANGTFTFTSIEATPKMEAGSGVTASPETHGISAFKNPQRMEKQVGFMFTMSILALIASVVAIVAT